MRMLAAHFPRAKIVGVDFAGSAIEKAQKKFPSLNFYQANLQDLADSWDATFLVNVLEHFEHPIFMLRKVLGRTNKLSIIMVPFREQGRHPEHCVSFDEDSFPSSLDGFNLVYQRVIDTSCYPRTLWPGKQLLAIYAKENALSLPANRFNDLAIIPFVAIIILNWNSWQETFSCLESLCKITYPYWQVIVVDNGSSNDSVAQIGAWACKHDIPLTLLPTGRNLGFTGGNNVGIRHAIKQAVDYVLLLNNDTTVARNFLEPLVEFAESHPHAGMIGPVVYEAAQPETIQSAGARIKWWTAKFPPVTEPMTESTPRQADYISGAAMLVRRGVIEAIGAFDETFFLYVEEVDWCQRARDAGHEIWCVPQSRIWHKGAVSADTMHKPLLEYYRFRNRIFFMRKHGHWFHWLVFGPYLARHIVGKLIGCTFSGRRELRSALWRALWDGLRMKSS